MARHRNHTYETLRLVRGLGLVRPADLEAHGVSRQRLYGLVREGEVEQLSRGIYAARRHSVTSEPSLALVGKRVPAGVFCLLTALRFHDLTTQNPAEVW